MKRSQQSAVGPAHNSLLKSHVQIKPLDVWYGTCRFPFASNSHHENT